MTTILVFDMWNDEKLDTISADSSSQAWDMAWEKWGWPDCMGADVKFVEVKDEGLTE